MTETATSAYLRDAGRTGSVIAVTSVARGRAEIAAHEQRLAMHAGAIFRELRRRERRPVCACEARHDFRIGMACAARLRHPLCVHFRLRIFGRPDPMNAMTAHARWRAIIVKIEKHMAVRTFFEFRELIRRQRRIELVHFGGIGMAARTEENDPRAIFLPIFLGPFFHMIMPEISRGIAAMTTGTRNAAPKMNVLHHFLEIHVRSRRRRCRCDCEKCITRLIC